MKFVFYCRRGSHTGYCETTETHTHTCTEEQVIWINHTLLWGQWTRGETSAGVKSNPRPGQKDNGRVFKCRSRRRRGAVTLMTLFLPSAGPRVSHTISSISHTSAHSSRISDTPVDVDWASNKTPHRPGPVPLYSPRQRSDKGPIRKSWFTNIYLYIHLYLH